MKKLCECTHMAQDHYKRRRANRHIKRTLVVKGGEGYPLEVGVPSLGRGGEQLSVVDSSTVHSHNGSLELILKENHCK